MAANEPFEYGLPTELPARMLVPSQHRSERAHSCDEIYTRQQQGFEAIRVGRRQCECRHGNGAWRIFGSVAVTEFERSVSM